MYYVSIDSYVHTRAGQRYELKRVGRLYLLLRGSKRVYYEVQLRRAYAVSAASIIDIQILFRKHPSICSESQVNMCQVVYNFRRTLRMLAQVVQKFDHGLRIFCYI